MLPPYSWVPWILPLRPPHFFSWAEFSVENRALLLNLLPIFLFRLKKKILITPLDLVFWTLNTTTGIYTVLSVIPGNVYRLSDGQNVNGESRLWWLAKCSYPSALILIFQSVSPPELGEGAPSAKKAPQIVLFSTTSLTRGLWGSRSFDVFLGSLVHIICLFLHDHFSLQSSVWFLETARAVLALKKYKILYTLSASLKWASNVPCSIDSWLGLYKRRFLCPEYCRWPVCLHFCFFLPCVLSSYIHLLLKYYH